jgi:protein phosphatase
MVEPTLEQRSAAWSERGRRRINQDAVLAETLPGGAELVVVADGMGGQAGGEVASRRALEVVREAVAGGQDLEAAVHQANAAVHAAACASAEFEGMGTTLVGLLRRGARYTVVNVGDSRAYRLDASGIRQLTEDHSFLAEALRTGRFSVEEAAKSPWRNAVTRSLGTEPELEVDSFGPFDAGEPHTVMLCTDGVYRALSDEELRRLVWAAGALDEAVQAIAAAAYEAGSDDNMSIALIRFGPPGIWLAGAR